MGSTRWLLLSSIAICVASVRAMSNAEKSLLRDEAKEMFFHAYNSYLNNAYPADELKPLSCSGRVRGVDASRGDVDDAMGNFAMTLIDSLDTLVVLGAIQEFSEAVKRVRFEVRLDSDVVVSVFETNIRVLGGLLSAHYFAATLKAQHEPLLSWYDNELLGMAKEIADRLLPAFETGTGIPYPRVNLRYGMVSSLLSTTSTCTACAGTMLLEFATLSRLTGDFTYEEKARKAMDAIWQRRSPHLLVGTTIDVHTGEWREQDSGVGAGIDSYYEYCLKAYVLLGDAEYLDRFNRHYEAVMNYGRRGNTLLDVHMYNPNNVAQSFVDSLGAFWPGLQVLAGEVPAAADLFSHMEHVVKRHKFMPEAYSVDGDGYWWHHFLRPEFAESAYFLHQATGSERYLEIGKTLLKNIQQHARVKCGFAAFSDVRTLAHDDRMDSFVLAETFKYLFLLFANKKDIPVELDDYVFTTEAHLLPLVVARNRSSVVNAHSVDYEIDGRCAAVHLKTENPVEVYSTLMTGELKQDMSSPRQALHATYNQCIHRQASTPIKLRLKPEELNAENPEHLQMLHDMGISIDLQGDGRVQFSHNSNNAKTPADSQEGIQFMQALIQLHDKIKSEQGTSEFVRVNILEPDNLKQVLIAGGARFGPNLTKDPPFMVTGPLKHSLPVNACSSLETDMTGRIALVQRGSCMFVEKVLHAEAAGAAGVIIYDTQKRGEGQQLISMTGNGSFVAIPSAFIWMEQASPLVDALTSGLVVVGKLETAAATEKDAVEQKPEETEEQLEQVPGDSPDDSTMNGAGSAVDNEPQENNSMYIQTENESGFDRDSGRTHSGNQGGNANP
ncbi:ER degradation-enhancing alpha-mannosidase-like protein 3 isoform X1 [Sycon ciliatum]|uniref:ER degradation-enhancing alpha-mannosidase-like protein 3 isoform X1 n=1 Tax=Sycon ciliatum TaxID=27933 RepID=UPI0031F703D0